MIKVYIQNMVPYADYKGEEILEVEEGLSLGALISRFGLEQHITVLNNGFVEEAYILQDGDRIKFIAVTSGG